MHYLKAIFTTTKIISPLSFFLLASYCLLFSACAGTKGLSEGKLLLEPEYELSDIRFVEADMKHAVLEIGLEVKNPNYVPLNFSKVTYVLKLDNEQVMEGSLNKGLQIPAKGGVNFSIPLEVQLSKLSMGAVNFLINRKVAYDFEVLFYSDIPVLDKKSFKGNRSGELNF